MRTILTAAALAAMALVAVAPATNADHWCDGRGWVIEFGAAGTNAAYLAMDSNYPWGGWTPWFYLESNGAQGLQRGGITLLGDADTCQDYADHDQGVF